MCCNGRCSTSDIWSVGSTVVELLTGSPPYFNLEAMAAMYRIVVDPVPPLPPNLGADLRDFLLLCFNKVRRGTGMCRANN
jgi:serine/threonine protein kinase